MVGVGKGAWFGVGIWLVVHGLWLGVGDAWLGVWGVSVVSYLTILYKLHLHQLKIAHLFWLHTTGNTTNPTSVLKI